ncbi:MAG: ribosome biogenesis GTPase YlqF [Firmicutes bacterium]|nr:ribosome biogenesis GTPase YlqF [Bacillota bacterium]
MGRPWYPGHMAAALRAVRENARLVDVVVEVVDARGPETSRDPALSRVIGDKPRVIGMARADLADPPITDRWVKWFRSQDALAFPVDALTGAGVRDLLRGCREALGEREARLSRGGRPRPLRIMVAGVPNVGKSSLINRMTSSGSARTGAAPGITRGKQWIRAGEGIEVLDLPGILKHRETGAGAQVKLALMGIIPETTYDTYEMGLEAVALLATLRPEMLTAVGVGDPAAPPELIIDELGRKRGFLMRGGEVDRGKAALWMIKQLRDGRAGRFSLETPS